MGKAEALAGVEERNPQSCADVYDIICDLAEAGMPFDADDIWPRLAGPLSSPCAVGAAFNKAMRAGVIVQLAVPPVNSRRNSNHGHPLRRWRARSPEDEE